MLHLCYKAAQGLTSSAAAAASSAPPVGASTAAGSAARSTLSAAVSAGCPPGSGLAAGSPADGSDPAALPSCCTNSGRGSRTGTACSSFWPGSAAAPCCTVGSGGSCSSRCCISAGCGSASIAWGSASASTSCAAAGRDGEASAGAASGAAAGAAAACMGAACAACACCRGESRKLEGSCSPSMDVSTSRSSLPRPVRCMAPPPREEPPRDGSSGGSSWPLPSLPSWVASSRSPGEGSAPSPNSSCHSSLPGRCCSCASGSPKLPPETAISPLLVPSDGSPATNGCRCCCCCAASGSDLGPERCRLVRPLLGGTEPWPCPCWPLERDCKLGLCTPDACLRLLPASAPPAGEACGPRSHASSPAWTSRVKSTVSSSPAARGGAGVGE